MELSGKELEAKDLANARYIPLAMKLSAFLRFLRSNSLYRRIGGNQEGRVSNVSVCTAIHSGAKIFAQIQGELIKFPDVVEPQAISMELSKMTGSLPVICGIIDGSHVEIQKISRNPAPDKFS